MKHKTPIVSVLLPVYNGQDYIKEAINSILCQTFHDFEFLVLDDASTDETWKLVGSYTDSRIRLLQNERNLGIAKSLNKLVNEAGGVFIARMDADDISLPTRLEKQLSYMKKFPNIGLLGTGIHKLSNGKVSRQTWQYPGSNNHIQWSLFYRCPFAHPTIMARRDLVISAGNYDPRPAEDWDLWEKMSWLTQMENLPEGLLVLRKHATNITNTRKASLITDSVAIIKRRIIRMAGNIEGYELSENIVRFLVYETGRISELVQALNQLFDVFETNFHINKIQRGEIYRDLARLVYKSSFRRNISTSERIYGFTKAHYFDPGVELGFVKNILSPVKK